MLQKEKKAKKKGGVKAESRKVLSVKSVKSAAKKTSVKKSAVIKKEGVSAKKPGFTVSNMRFQVEGLNCAGKLYLPAGIKNAPVIIMANGLGLDMDSGLPIYAAEFARNGYAVFTFDYRYYGESEGEPRHLILPKRQLKDWESAIEFVSTLHSIDCNRICLWGFSLSGGHVIVASAVNQKVKGFISHMPYMDPMFIMKISGFKKVMSVNAAGYKDLLYSITGRAPHNMQIMGKPDEFAMMNTAECYDGFMSIIPDGSGWRNEMPARSMVAASFYRPFKYIPRIKCRGMVVTGEHDSQTDNKMVERAFATGEQFRLLSLKCGHFGLFTGENFRKALAAELEFLKSVF